MKKFIRAISAVLACVIVFSLTGCKSKEDAEKYIAEYNGIKMETGIYVVQMMGAYMEAASLVKDPQGDIFKQDIEGKNAKEWIIDKTKQYMAENFAIVSKFKEKGLELKEDEVNYVKQVSDQQWMYLGASYSQSGVTKDDLIAINTINMKASSVFENVYGKGGEKEVPETEVRPIYEKNYLKVSYLPVYKFAADGTPLEGDELAKLKTMANDYYSRLKAGESMETLTAEYQAVLEAEQKALEEKAAAEQKAKEEAEKTEDEKDEKSDKDKAVVKADAAEKPKEDAKTEDKAEDNKTENKENTEDVKEEAPKKHTMVFNKENQQIFDEKFVKDVENAKVGDKLFFENDQYYLIAVKEDINEDEQDYKDKSLEIMLQLKSEEFTALISEWAKDINPKYDSILTAQQVVKLRALSKNQQTSDSTEKTDETTKAPETDDKTNAPVTEDNAKAPEANAKTENK